MVQQGRSNAVELWVRETLLIWKIAVDKETTIVEIYFSVLKI